MHRYLLFALFLAVIAALPHSSSTEKQFAEYVARYNRHYPTQAEYNRRYQNFLETLVRIEYKNARSKNAKYGITEYADLSQTELLQKKSTPLPAAIVTRSCLASGVSAPHIPEDSMDVPDSFDWRTRNVVTPVKNQGQCGSCWTFSTTGNIESLLAIAGKPLLGLSEQEIVDCSTACSPVEGQQVCNSGCEGGWPWAAMGDIMNWGGLETETAYPYLASDGTCQQNNKNPRFGALANFTCIGTNATQIVLNLLSRGPLSVALDATLVEDYTSGIINPWFPDDDCDPTQLDHAVLIVGYGVEEGDFSNTPYWIVKNSWGATWGEQGYFRIYRGEGLCGINNSVSSAILA